MSIHPHSREEVIMKSRVYVVLGTVLVVASAVYAFGAGYWGGV